VSYFLTSITMPDTQTGHPVYRFIIGGYLLYDIRYGKWC